MRVDVKYAAFPSAVDVELAKSALTSLQALLKSSTSVPHMQFRTQTDGGTVMLDLPRQAVDILGQVLGHLSKGNGVAVLDATAELTTQQAADLLNVSRPYVIKLLEAGELDYRLVGKHRRILAASLLAYKQADMAKREAVIQELTDASREMGLY